MFDDVLSIFLNPLSKHSAFRSQDVGLKHCVIWVSWLLDLWDVLSHAIKL